VFGTAHRARGTPSCGLPPHPCDGELEALTGPFSCPQHMVDDLPDALFAICHGSGGRLPEGRHVPRQRLDGLTLRRGEGTGLLLHESVVVLLQLPLCGEFLLPPLGQLSSDQPVLVFHQPVVASRPLGLIGGPLQALLPETVRLPAFALQVGGGLQGDRQGGRFKRLKDPLMHEGVHRLTREVLAIVSP
jgi:hypothetical protein